MKTVLLRAPVLTRSGYGTHSRQVFSWLLKRHPDVDLYVQPLMWGHTPWLIDHGACDGIVSEIMSRSKPTSGQPDVAFQLQLPNEWDPSIGKFNVGMTACVETTSCSDLWKDRCNMMDLVIVPSNHAKKLLTDGGRVNVPVMVVPESFPDAFLDDTVRGTLIDLEPEFNFLIFGQITGQTFQTDRKGIYMGVRWLCEEFRDNRDVGIVIKTNMGRNSLIDRQNTVSQLTELVKTARGASRFPKIKLLHGEMSDADVKALYTHPKIKALVALTKGEGFGLPILEAAALELPVIAPAWSGHTDFMNLGKYVDVAYNVTDVHPSKIDNSIFMPGTKWAECSEADFKRRASKLVSSYSVPKQWARDLGAKLRERYSPNAIYDAYDAVEQLKRVL